jgi:signal transduction histidine kinase
MTSDHEQLRRLLDVGRSLVTELDPEAVLVRILEEARDITGARYVALGVLNARRDELERFLTLGVEGQAREVIGDLPRGRGVLGLLITDPRPLRISDVGSHPRSYGFPPGHPPMRGFLGVPIMIRGQAWGNLYLTEKADTGDFSDEDEQAAVALAGFAATAIENARLYQRSEAQRIELGRAVRGLEAARDVADAISGIPVRDRILELIVKRGRALVNARTVLIMLRDGPELVVAAAAGYADEDARDRRVLIADSTSGEVLERQRTARISDVHGRMRIAPEALGIPDAHTALLVPMVHHGTAVGVLAVFDRGTDSAPFTDTEEQLLRTFASSAANAVAMSRSVEAERLRSTVASADAERTRWARELHDETLQTLGGLRVGLASALRNSDPAIREDAMRQAIEDIQLGIENLRAIITDLRPSLLDDLGLAPAIEALVERRAQPGLEIVSELSLPDPGHLNRELETTIYRLIQEALTNVVKHADANRVRVSVTGSAAELTVEIEDNGTGFDPDSPSSGFGLAGMRERVFLAGGTLEVASGARGTLIRARIPVLPAARLTA